MKLLFWRKRAKKERTMKIEGKFATEIRWNSIFFFYSSHSTAFIAWERIQITMELLPFFYILRQNACFNIAFVSFMRRVEKKKKKNLWISLLSDCKHLLCAVRSMCVCFRKGRSILTEMKILKQISKYHFTFGYRNINK